MEHAHPYLDNAIGFLLAAVLVVTTFRRLNISPIVGYLITGVLLGPFGMAFIQDLQATKFLAQFGVVFLLFTIGLKLPLQRLQVLKRYVFGLGLAQVALSSAVIAGIALLLKLEMQTAILVGTGLALSSTAVGLQILTEGEELASRFGRATFSVLLFQDLAVVVLLVLLTTLGKEPDTIFAELGFAALKAGIVLTLIVLVGRVIFRPAYKLFVTFGNPELLVAMTLLVVLGTSMATAEAGLSMELGAFLAGLLLSETEYRHQVEADIQPFHGLLLGLFFMTVGMSIDLKLVNNYLMYVLLGIGGLFLIKSTIIVLLGRLFNLSWVGAFRAAFLLAGGGEFVFVLFAIASERALMPDYVTQICYAVVAISMGITPFLEKLGKQLDRLHNENVSQANLRAAAEETHDLRNHVIIAGFGRAGRLVARMLAERMIPYVAVDTRMNIVTEWRSKRLPVFYADARRQHAFRALGGAYAKAAVISLPSASASMQMALMLRDSFPNLAVFVRMPNDTYREKLTKLGIMVLTPENLEPSLQLGAAVLQQMGSGEEEVKQILDKFRKSLTAAPLGEGAPSKG